MSTRKLGWVAIALVLLVTSLATGCGASSNKIVVATDATWPPMEYVDENREIVGYDIDLMKAIAEEAGLEVEFKNVAWDGIFAGLAAGEYDAVISSVTITDERRENYDFSDPYINAGQIVVVDAGARPHIIGGDVAVWHGEFDEPPTEGRLRVLALNPELVWLSHEHEPWRPSAG